MQLDPQCPDQLEHSVIPRLRAGRQCLVQALAAEPRILGQLRHTTRFPAGVTVTVVPATTTGTAASLQVTAATNATLGNATLTITGTSAGAATQVATLVLTVTPALGVTLSASPAALTIARGASGATSVGLARTEFMIPVTLAAENLPAGVTAVFVGNPTTGTLSTLTLTASAAATQGTVTVTIRATGAGIPASTTTLQLTIP